MGSCGGREGGNGDCGGSLFFALPSDVDGVYVRTAMLIFDDWEVAAEKNAWSAAAAVRYSSLVGPLAAEIPDRPFNSSAANLLEVGSSKNVERVDNSDRNA